MSKCYIVTIVNGMVDNINSFGDNPTTDEIKESFLDEVSNRISNFDEYSKSDQDAICDNGYEAFGNGSIQIFCE